MSKLSLVQDENKFAPLMATDIEQMLAARIRTGAYPKGSQLPTVRDLASELSVNKNTIVRAYQALERKGFLELIRGRGAFVRTSEPVLGEIDSRWLARLDELVIDAKQRNLARELVLAEITARVETIFGQSDLKLAFIECNQQDIDEMATQLARAVRHPFKGVLLDEFLARPHRTAGAYDLVVTTFYHLNEVNRALGNGKHENLIAVHAMPNHDALLELARLHAPVIGLVAALPSVVDTLTHIVQTYHPMATLMGAVIDDAPRVKMLLHKADAVVITRAFAPQLLRYKPEIPVVVVTFTIDQQSVAYLNNRIQVENKRMLETGAPREQNLRAA
ncbi:MAG: GntR family transcriptional regulator [Anaerolineae bacterium]|nr:GntR family transcriptional regulator [Anaerolineae bacterium]